jgi:hypothetical protein
MKLKFGFLLFLLAVPAAAWSQSTLNFPRQFAPSDLSGTGFALVNPNTSVANVTLTMYSATGSTVGIAASSVPAKGQLAGLGTDFFSNASAAGWVQVTSSTTGLTGFWLSGDVASYDSGEDGSAGTKSATFWASITRPSSLQRCSGHSGRG